MKFKVILGAILVAGLVIGGIVVVRMRPGSEGSKKAVASEMVAYIDITDTGFVPDTLRVKAGTKVHWLNKTESPHRVASNPYPDHTELPSLDSVEPIGPEETYSYTFDKKGEWGYHDDYNPMVGGTVKVE